MVITRFADVGVPDAPPEVVPELQPVTISANADATAKPITGLIGYFICSPYRCFLYLFSLS